MKRLILLVFLVAFAFSPYVHGQDEDDEEQQGRARVVIETGGHHSEVIQLTYRDGGKELVTVTHDTDIRIWDVISGELKQKVRPSLGVIQSAAFSKDRNTLAVVGYREGVPIALLVDLRKREITRVLEIPRGTTKIMKYLALSNNGQYLAVGSTFPNGLHVFDLQSKGPPMQPKSAIAGGKHPVAFSPDSKQLAVGFGQKKSASVHIYDLPSLKLAAKLNTPLVQGVAWPVGNRLFVGTESGVQVWNPKKEKLEHEWNVGSTSAFEFLMDGKKIAKIITVGAHADETGRLEFVNPDTGTVERSLPVAKVKPAPHAAAFAPDGFHFATSFGKFNAVQTFDSSTKKGAKKELKFVGIGATTTNAAFAKKGHVITWQQNGKSLAFDFSKLEFVATPSATQPILSRIETKEYVVRVAAARAIHVEKAGNPKDYTVRLGHKGFINSLCLSGDGKYIVTSSEDQTVRVYAMDSSLGKAPLLTLFHTQGEWVVWSRAGHFAGSPGGLRLVGMQINSADPSKLATFSPIDRFQAFYQPEVIKQVLVQGSHRAAVAAVEKAGVVVATRNATIEDSLPPRVTVEVDETKKPTIVVKAKAIASSKSQLVQALQLALDGKLVKDTEVKFAGGKFEADATWNVVLTEGTHKISVRGSGPSSSEFSDAPTVEGPPSTRRPIMHVLCVGVSKYQNPNLNLNAAAQDANNAGLAFSKHCKGDLYSEVTATELLDEAANAKAVLDKITQIRQKAEASDLFVFYFAGHGVKEKDQFYLLTHEANLNALKGTSLSGDDLTKALGAFKCQVMLLMDACHSGGIGGRQSAVDDATRALTTDDVGVVVFSAAMGNQKAIEIKGKGGLFTTGLIEGLEAGPKVPRNPYNHRIFVHHLKSYLVDYVMHHSEERQTPFVNWPWTVESFPILEKK